MALADQLVSAVCRIRYDGLPAGTVERAKLFFLDTMGVMLAGRNAEGVPDVIDLLKEFGGSPQAKIIGTDFKSQAPLAAMANSLMAHARDFDDLHEPGGAHVNITVVPAALAAAQKKGGVTGKRLLTAVIAGVDIVCRLGVSVHTYPGWHVSAIFGVFGAALATGLLLDLTPKQLANALGLAYSQCSGTRQGRMEGTLAKRLQPALASQSGVLSALLAQKGLTGPKNWLEGLWGIARVYGREHDKLSDTAIKKFKNGLGKSSSGTI